MVGQLIRTAFAGALILVLLSCAQPTRIQEHRPNRLSEFDTRHWVHNEGLRSVMVVLERETLATWPQEVENEYAAKGAEKIEHAIAEARSLAGRLASSSPTITAAVRAVRMSEADRRAFAAQADTLRDQAQRLYDAAESGDIDRMRLDLKSIRATCRSCHERFRELAGSINEGSK